MNSIKRLFDFPYYQLENYNLEKSLVSKKKGKWIADLEGTRILAQAFQGHSLESVQLARSSSRLL